MNTTTCPQDTDLLPEGDYLAKIINANFVPTRPNGGDEFLEIEFKIVAGPYAGKILAQLHDPISRYAMERKIFRQEITRICQAAGIPRPSNWEDRYAYRVLCGAILVISVIRATYGDDITVNHVIGYKKI